MTLNEKRELLGVWCDSHDGCQHCYYSHDDEAWCNHYSERNIPEDFLDTVLKQQNLLPEIEEPVDSTPDNTEDVIHHPNHYCREGAMECIDEMIKVFGIEAVKHFCICNVWKYRYRASDKNGQEDIHKSDEYMRIYDRLCMNEQP